MQKQSINIPYRLAILFSNRKLNLFYTYTTLKAIYNKPIFYNFTYTKLSLLSGISAPTLHRHVKQLKDLGLLSIQNGHLCLTGVNTLKKQYKSESTIKFSPPKNRKEAREYLLYIILANQSKRQVSAIKDKTEIVKTAKSESYKRYTKKQRVRLKKQGGAQNIEKSIQNRVTLSNRKQSQLFNRSTRTIQRYTKTLSENGYILLIRAYRKHGQVNIPKLGKDAKERLKNPKYKLSEVFYDGENHVFDVVERLTNTFVLNKDFRFITNEEFENRYKAKSNEQNKYKLVTGKKYFCYTHTMLHSELLS